MKLILYVDSGHQSHLHVAAKRIGWNIRNIPKFLEGIPVLKEMYQDVITNSQPKTMFYAYSNMDILFRRNLVCTLKFLCEHLHDVQHLRTHVNASGVFGEYSNSTLSSGMLVVGRRFNVNNTDFHLNFPLPHLMRRYGQVFQSNALDYFITTKDSLPWSKIPDFVIGRVGYDNWIVSQANKKWGTVVLDATCAITAVHQTGSDGNKAGLTSHNATLNINKDLAGNFNYKPGSTDCCIWALQRDEQHQYRIAKKEQNSIPRHCYTKTGLETIQFSSGECEPSGNFVI